MKVKIQCSELKKHKGILKVTKRNSRFVNKSSITITASENLVITGMGFSATLECETESWGRVTLPFAVWEKIIRLLASFLDENITLSAEDGLIELNGMELRNPSIQVTKFDNTLYPIPFDASQTDIISYVFNNIPERFETLQDRDMILKILHRLLVNIDYASQQLTEWGIRSVDTAIMVAYKLKIKKPKPFLKALFSKEVRSYKG